jgi:hypothetical protein
MIVIMIMIDSLCGLVVGVPGCKSKAPGFDCRHYQIFWEEVVGLERGPLSLVSTTEELLERKISGSCLVSRDYGRRDPSRWPRSTPLTTIVADRSRPQATVFGLV